MMPFTCRVCFFILCVVVFMDHAHARSSVPSWKDIRNALKEVVNEDNGGFGLNQWAVVVDRDNIVQAVVYSGDHRGDQWPGSRQIAAIKACTANSFSLPHFAISTANLYGLSQAGGPLFGIQSSLPPYLDALYKGKPSNWGTSSDPMIGYPVGGVVVFGGGLPLYSKSGELIGGLGVSGDTSCTDHIVAWKLRHLLELDYVPNGFGGKTNVMYGSYDNLGHGSGVTAADHPYCDKREASIVSKLHKGDYAVRT